MTNARKGKKIKSVSYAKWGYLFITPFFIVYILFNLIPLFTTIYNSFFENYMSGLRQIGPTFIGLDNYVKLFSANADGSAADIWTYLSNTMVMWILGFVPQVLVSLLFAIWFTSGRLRIKFQRFFKTVMYMPNLIMASAFSMLFFALFSPGGPVNQILLEAGSIQKEFFFFDNTQSVRIIIASMNFLMWFGNTTILMMASIMGIDVSLFEAAELDGASSGQLFFKVTFPLIMPMIAYVVITSLIGGLQMFDVPQILSNGMGTPNRTSMTLIMFLNRHLTSKNYGMAGAVSVFIFVVTAILSIIVYQYMMKDNALVPKKEKRRRR